MLFFKLDFVPFQQRHEFCFKRPGVVVLFLVSNVVEWVVFTLRLEWQQESRTDARGQYEFRGVPAGEVIVVAAKGGSTPIRQLRQITEGGPVDLDFVMPVTVQPGIRAF